MSKRPGSNDTHNPAAIKRTRRSSSRLQEAREAAAVFMLRAHAADSVPANNVTERRLALMTRLRHVRYVDMPPNIQAEVRAEIEGLGDVNDETWATLVKTLLSPAAGAQDEREARNIIVGLLLLMAREQQWAHVPAMIRALVPLLDPSSNEEAIPDTEMLQSLLRDTDFVTQLVTAVAHDEAAVTPILESAIRHLTNEYDKKAFIKGLLRGVLRTARFSVFSFFRGLIAGVLPMVAITTIVREVLLVSDTDTMFEKNLGHLLTAAELVLAKYDSDLSWLCLCDAIQQDKRAFVERFYDQWQLLFVRDETHAVPLSDFARLSSLLVRHASPGVMGFLLDKLPDDEERLNVVARVADLDRADFFASGALASLMRRASTRILLELIRKNAVACLRWWSATKAEHPMFFADVIAGVIHHAMTHGNAVVTELVLNLFPNYAGDKEINSEMFTAPLAHAQDLVNREEYLHGRSADSEDDDDDDGESAKAKAAEALRDLKAKMDFLRTRGFTFTHTVLAEAAVLPGFFEDFMRNRLLPLHDDAFVDKLVQFVVVDGDRSRPILMRLVELEAVQPRHLSFILSRMPIVKGEAWVKQLSMAARPAVAGQMGKLGYWIDQLSAQCSDPMLRMTALNMAHSDPNAFQLKINGDFLRWDCTYAPTLTTVQNYKRQLEDEHDRVKDSAEEQCAMGWALSQRLSGAVLLKYIHLHEEMQRLGLGQHRVQVAEQAVTRADPGLGVDHVVLDWVHSPSFFASDVRFGWFDMTRARQRDANDRSLYYWFGHTLGGRNALANREPTHRVWSTPAALAIHRAQALGFSAEDVLRMARVARTLSHYVSSDVPPPDKSDSFILDVSPVKMHVTRLPLTNSDTATIQLKHHLLRLGNHDRLPCEVIVEDLSIDASAANDWPALLLQLMVDLGRVWCRPLHLRRPEWRTSAVKERMAALTRDPAARFDYRGYWVPQPRPPSYARPKKPADENEQLVPLNLPAVEPPLVWLVAPGRDRAADPYAPGQPPPFPGRYDHEFHIDALADDMAALYIAPVCVVPVHETGQRKSVI